MCRMTTKGGYEGKGSPPDRVDALVWALTELMIDPPAAHWRRPRMRTLG